MSGLYHLVSPECMTKYDFGVMIARRFGFDPDQIEPISVHDFGLAAARSPRLTLDCSKLTAALGRPLPDVRSGMERFALLEQQGHPELLKQMVLLS